MRTVQLTLDEDLVKSVDRITKALHTTRSAFTREALQEAVRRFHAGRLEAQHRKGYQTQPVTRGEFDVWEQEHAWGSR